MDETEYPEYGSVWEHHPTGNIYRVLLITNQQTQRPDKYPITVVYENTNTGTTWSRPLSEWHRSMSLSKYLN